MAVSRRIARSGGERPATWVTRSAGNRSVIALWLGGAAVAGAALSPAFAQFDQIPLHFAWSMLFPMIAAMAFGRANGLLAAIAGPVLIPFLLWQGAGWGSASFSLTCFLWLGWIGHCVERRKQTAALWNHPAVAPLPLLLLTPLLYLAVMPALLHLNSLSPWHERTVDHLSALSILAIAVKQVASFCFALLGARCLLKLPAVRRLVGLTTPPSFRFNGTILAATLALLMALSVTMVALDTLLIGGSDLTAVLQSPYELVGLVFVALLLLAGSLLCCRFIEQQIATTDHLRHVESELRFSEERFELAMQAANDGLIDWAPQQQRLYLSPRWRSVLGYRDSEIPLRPVQWASLLHPDDRQPAMTTLQRALDGDETRVEIEFRALHFDGGYRHIKARAMILRDAQQRPSRVIGTQRDVTEAVEAARRQKQAEAVFNTTLEGVVVADEGGLIVAANPALTSLSGYSETQLLGQPLAFLSADGGTSLGTETIPSDSDHWKGSVWIRQQSGEILPQWLTLSVVRDNHGKPINYVGIYTDISALRKNAAQMEFLAHHDPLTNLPNRLLLKSRLIHALDMVKRRHGRGAVLFLDLDHFKQVNDSLGHRYGDELLQQLVQRLRNRLRESDTLARLGGDEFVAILEDVTGPNDAAVVAANLIEQAGLPFN